MIWRVAFPSGNERPHFIGVDFVTCPALSARDRGAGATAQSPDDFGWLRIEARTLVRTALQ